MNKDLIQIDYIEQSLEEGKTRLLHQEECVLAPDLFDFGHNQNEETNAKTNTSAPAS